MLTGALTAYFCLLPKSYQYSTILMIKLMFNSSWKNYSACITVAAIHFSKQLQEFWSAVHDRSSNFDNSKNNLSVNETEHKQGRGKQPQKNDQSRQPTTTSRHNDRNNHNATAGNDHPNAGNDDATIGNNLKQRQPTTTAWHNDGNNYNTTAGNDDTTVGSDANATTNRNHKTQRPQQPCGNCRKWQHNCRKQQCNRNNHNATMGNVSAAATTNHNNDDATTGNDDTTAGNDDATSTTNHNHKKATTTTTTMQPWKRPLMACGNAIAQVDCCSPLEAHLLKTLVASLLSLQ